MAIIEVEGLRKRYGETVVVHDVSFTVQRGEIFGLLGPAGAGKTTTLECIEGLRRRDGGKVQVLGLDPHYDQAKLRKRLGVQLQHCTWPDRLRVSELLDLFASFYPDTADPEELINRLGLTGQCDAAFGTLSADQQQRLSIALVLVGKPEIVVLDEFALGLDPPARRMLWELIRKVRDSGVTVLMVTPFLDEAERLCDRIAVLDAGRVVALDTPAGLLSRTNLGQGIRFRPTRPLEIGVLTALPEVSSVRRDGDYVVVAGVGAVVRAVTSVLARRGIIATDLELVPANLDDVFIALTGHGLAPEHPGHPGFDRSGPDCSGLGHSGFDRSGLDRSDGDRSFTRHHPDRAGARR